MVFTYKPFLPRLMRFLSLIQLAFFVFGISITAHAQVYSGSLTGVVTDPSGAAVPNAQVALTDEERGFAYPAKTDNDGRYVLRNLPPGRYRLSLTAPGMRAYTQ